MVIEGGKGKVGVVGTGMVGASFAYALMQSGLASEMVLIDRDEARAAGEAMDLNHGLPFVRPMRIHAGGYAQLAGSDVVVISAGANQRPGETRIDLLAKNVGVFEDIIPKVVAASPQSIIVVVTNPVDILTQMSAEIAGLAPGHVIGSGTLLDSARFRFNLADYYDMDSRSIRAWIVAEHGDTAVPLWSSANVAGMPLRDFRGPNGKGYDEAAMQDIFVRTRDAAYAIIDGKQSTYYAIGLSMLTIVEAILRDQRTVLPVCMPLSGQYGVKGMALGLPAVVGHNGVEQILEIPMDAKEIEGFRASAQTLKDRRAEIKGKR